MQNRSKARKSNLRCLLMVRQVKVRSSTGWSLVATLILMVVITSFVAAMWGTLLPEYQHLANLRYKDAIRSVNEGTIDSQLASINTAGMTPPAQYGGTSTNSSVVTQGGASFNVSTTLTNLGTAGGPGVSVPNGGPPLNCIFYLKTRPVTQPFLSLTSTVTKNGAQRTLTCLLDPIPAPSSQSPWQTGGMMGVSVINQVGLVGLNGYNLPPGWNNPYQFNDTTVVNGVTWQIGNGSMRSQVIAGSQFEFWQPGQQPALPNGTIPLVYEPFTQIMGNVYSNYTDQNGANGNGYWTRDQLTDYAGGSNLPNGGAAGGGWKYGSGPLFPATSLANVFGAANGTPQAGQFGGVPSGYPSAPAATATASVPIPTYINPNPPTNGSQSTVSPSNWGYNTSANLPLNNGPTGTTAGNYPQAGTPTGGAAYQANPYTGGYITSPGPGAAGAQYNAFTNNGQNGYQPPTVSPAPGAPIGVPAPAIGGLGVPNNTGTYFGSSPTNVLINGGNLYITNTAATVPANLNVSSGQTVNIPPGNYNLASLQVVNGGSITVDPNVQGQTQFFMTPSGSGQGTAAAIYVDNTSSINMTGITSNGDINGFTQTGTTGYGAALPNTQLAVNTANPIVEASGSCQNLVINTNANCNMLFAGNARALVDAPNANVNIGYQPNPNNSNSYTANSYQDPAAPMARDANFYGGIVGGSVNVVSAYGNNAAEMASGGAYMHYDINLKKVNQALPLGGVRTNAVAYSTPISFYDPWQYGKGGVVPGATQKWRAASWQEQLGAW